MKALAISGACSSVFVFKNVRHIPVIAFRAYSVSSSDLAPGTEFHGPESAKKHEELVGYLRKQYRRYGYSEIITPNLLRLEQLKKYGQTEFKDCIIVGSEDDKFVVKSSGKVSACLIFDSSRISHRFLPIRYVDFGVLHKAKTAPSKSFIRWNEDQASCFCQPKRLEDELKRVFSTTIETIRGLNVEMIFHLSRGPFEPLFDRVFHEHSVKYEVVNSDDAVVKGYIKTSRGEYHKGTSIEVDEETPRIMDLHYYDESTVKTTPVLISHTIVGPFNDFIKLRGESQHH